MTLLGNNPHTKHAIQEAFIGTGKNRQKYIKALKKNCKVHNVKFTVLMLLKCPLQE